MKKLVMFVVVTMMVAMMWACSHIYRSDAEVRAIAYNGFKETVTVRLENGHLYAFDIIDSEDLYNVHDIVNFAMWDGLTPDDPTDDIIL